MQQIDDTYQPSRRSAGSKLSDTKSDRSSHAQLIQYRCPVWRRVPPEMASDEGKKWNRKARLWNGAISFCTMSAERRRPDMARGGESTVTKTLCEMGHTANLVNTCMPVTQHRLFIYDLWNNADWFFHSGISSDSSLGAFIETVVLFFGAHRPPENTKHGHLSRWGMLEMLIGAVLFWRSRLQTFASWYSFTKQFAFNCFTWKHLKNHRSVYYWHFKI